MTKNTTIWIAFLGCGKCRHWQQQQDQSHKCPIEFAPSICWHAFIPQGKKNFTCHAFLESKRQRVIEQWNPVVEDKQQLTSFSAVGIQGIQRRPDRHLIHIDYSGIRVQLVVITRVVCVGVQWREEWYVRLEFIGPLLNIILFPETGGQTANILIHRSPGLPSNAFPSKKVDRVGSRVIAVVVAKVVVTNVVCGISAREAEETKRRR